LRGSENRRCLEAVLYFGHFHPWLPERNQRRPAHRSSAASKHAPRRNVTCRSRATSARSASDPEPSPSKPPPVHHRPPLSAARPRPLPAGDSRGTAQAGSAPHLTFAPKLGSRGEPADQLQPKVEGGGLQLPPARKQSQCQPRGSRAPTAQLRLSPLRLRRAEPRSSEP